MLSTSSESSKSSQRFLRISAIHHNMAHFISESTVHEYQYSIEHFPETSSLMTSGSGTNYDFSICSRSSHSSLSLKELQTSFPDVEMPPLVVKERGFVFPLCPSGWHGLEAVDAFMELWVYCLLKVIDKANIAQSRGGSMNLKLLDEFLHRAVALM